VAKQKPPRAATRRRRRTGNEDGGSRPAYNVQIISTPERQMIVTVDIDTSGSDRGLAQPGMQTGRRPAAFGNGSV
jgi:hypothetical protein